MKFHVFINETLTGSSIDVMVAGEGVQRSVSILPTTDKYPFDEIGYRCGEIIKGIMKMNTGE